MFFEFERKGLVSATPLEFSDPRFQEHEFTRYIITPDYDFSKPLELIQTNNVLEAFKDYLSDNPVDQYCIFINSTNTIEAIVKQLGLQSKSAVFCAEESADKLTYKDLPIAKSDFKVKFMKKYNFFTSRYFSAFDMKVSGKPDVVMLTDVYFAKHSILDPQTEVIQIAGRLRNGSNKLTHITNFNPDLKSMAHDDAITYLQGIKDMFGDILKLAFKMPHKGMQDFLEQIRKVELAKFFKEDGQYDWFMFDNFLQEERVKGYYQRPENLTKAYMLLEKYFNLSSKTKLYALGDGDRLKRESAEGRKILLKEMAQQIDGMEKAVFCLNKPEAINTLRSISDPLVTGYYLIGIEGLEKANYSEARIKKAVEARQQSDLFKSAITINKVYKYLNLEGKSICKYTDERIREVLNRIYNKVGIKKKAKASDIKRFFQAKRTTMTLGKTTVHGYELFKKPF
jgi:hypothetical protein